MVILAIDTTTRAGSIAVTRDDDSLAIVEGDQTRTHGERIPAEIARALDEAGLPKHAIDLIAVAAGPGAFTGLRIGLAAAQGLALTLNRPVVGVSALDALAWTVIDAHDNQAVLVAAWMDAQRGDVFAALYRVQRDQPTTAEQWAPWTVASTAVTASPEAVLDSWQLMIGTADVVFVGDAVSRDASHIARAGRDRWRIRQPMPLAPAIARIGRRLAALGRAGQPHVLTPIYVRRPDAEIERDRRTSS